MEDKNTFEELFAKLDEVSQKTIETISESTKTLRQRVSDEKRKAEVRSEIGHNKRELAKIYEQLGRAYYAHKVSDVGIEKEEEVFDRIRSKEKLIELMEEKLKTL